jgi:endonuclease-3 related protein
MCKRYIHRQESRLRWPLPQGEEAHTVPGVVVPDKVIEAVYERLLNCYGPQFWWPAESAFEVMIGAILTQNTAWNNVERALENLKRLGTLSTQAIMQCPKPRLAEALRPSGYYNVKADRLRSFCAWFLSKGELTALQRYPTTMLRRELLNIRGIGPETADDILLYAFERPVFVIDAYTRRLFARLGLIQGSEPYAQLRAQFESALNGQTPLYNEYHALIVRHGKDICRRKPRCALCTLAGSCAAGRETLSSP